MDIKEILVKIEADKIDDFLKYLSTSNIKYDVIKNVSDDFHIEDSNEIENINNVSILENVECHEESRKIVESIVTPDHERRFESPEFRKSKAQLKKDGHYECWVCGSKENLQAHHFAAEWSLANCVDFDKLKKFCEEWDPYGYGKALNSKPMVSIDDVRNMLLLCPIHHICINKDNNGSGTGIHTMTFPAFIIQKLAKDGENPIPQPGENAKELIKEEKKEHLEK